MPNLKYNPQEPLAPGRPHEGWCPYQGDAQAQKHAGDWLAHVEAGRIGNNPPCPPEVAARREANEGVLKRAFKG